MNLEDIILNKAGTEVWILHELTSVYRLKKCDSWQWGRVWDLLRDGWWGDISPRIQNFSCIGWVGSGDLKYNIGPIVDSSVSYTWSILRQQVLNVLTTQEWWLAYRNDFTVDTYVKISCYTLCIIFVDTLIKLEKKKHKFINIICLLI